jgi:hypothetical protein
MNSDQATALRGIVNQLEIMTHHQAADNAIIPDYGIDEAMLVGTPGSFLCLAKRLIEIIYYASEEASWSKIEIEEETIEGMTVLGTDVIKQCFDEFSPVWPVCAYMAADEKAARGLVETLAARWLSSAGRK